MRDTALNLLRTMLGDQAEFRPVQWEAIEAAVSKRNRVLVVQRTGWGKSAVYFLATKILRNQGSGPSLLVSPLLSLMRDQLRAADRIGVRASAIHSGNRHDWDSVKENLAANRVDLLMISPERLANPDFRKQILDILAGRIGMLIVDEAHCISDWGHDFRPDYRRIQRLINYLPRTLPVIATTATANDRVTKDVADQLGKDVIVLRGPLTRASLRLQNLVLGESAARLAWLAENLPKFEKQQLHGIIYCLTVADCDLVANWLKTRGLHVESYHADLSTEEREARESALRENRVLGLVATVALGMGFDKPDLGFVVHYQRPPSVISYYQQVGRAGRALEKAYGILLSGIEDDEIAEYFIQSAFPRLSTFEGLLKLLGQSAGISRDAIAVRLNASYREVDTALKIMEVEGAIGVTSENKKRLYFRTPRPWQADAQRIAQITAQRRAEQKQMSEYVQHKQCLMQFLAAALDDRTAKPCGLCANCQGKGFSTTVDAALRREAEGRLKVVERIIEPRLRWPVGFFPERERLTILPEERNETGRALCHYGDGGWGKRVRDGKYQQNQFSADLAEAAVELIRNRWKPDPAPEWVTAIPSPRRPSLVQSLAQRIALALGLPFLAAFQANTAAEQKTMANSAMQSRNARAMLQVDPKAIRPGPVLLIDDMIDSGWTLTVAGWLLRSNGSGPVHPFALARSTPRDG